MLLTIMILGFQKSSVPPKSSVRRVSNNNPKSSVRKHTISKITSRTSSPNGKLALNSQSQKLGIDSYRTPKRLQQSGQNSQQQTQNINNTSNIVPGSKSPRQPHCNLHMKLRSSGKKEVDDGFQTPKLPRSKGIAKVRTAQSNYTRNFMRQQTQGRGGKNTIAGKGSCMHAAKRYQSRINFNKSGKMGLTKEVPVPKQKGFNKMDLNFKKKGFVAPKASAKRVNKSTTSGTKSVKSIRRK